MPRGEALRPNSQLTTDSQFYERWADRPRPAPPPDPAPAPGQPWNKGMKMPMKLASGQVVDPAFEARFRRLWLSGVTSKRIEQDLGVSRTTVTRLRRKLGLPHRREADDRVNPAQPVHVHVTLAKVDYDEVVRRCHVQGKKASVYLRDLVRRDLGR